MRLPVYPTFPPMKCDAGCGDCCGFAPCNDAEMAAIRQYIGEHGITPVRQGVTCPLYIGGVCSVYPVRPMICRMFGHSPRMVCSRGYNVNVNPRREQRVMERYGKVSCLTHEVAYTGDEINEILKG